MGYKGGMGNKGGMGDRRPLSPTTMPLFQPCSLPRDINPRLVSPPPLSLSPTPPQCLMRRGRSPSPLDLSDLLGVKQVPLVDLALDVLLARLQFRSPLPTGESGGGGGDEMPGTVMGPVIRRVLVSVLEGASSMPQRNEATVFSCVGAETSG